ncbi:MAG: DoxX family protein [Pyrinomonadaceae bacterium]
MNITLWIVQVLLAALFVFAGVMKFVMPVDEMVGQTGLPGPFFWFIGAVEILGGLGLVLPGLLRIRTGLTPLAAAGLFIIMIGATVLSFKGGAAAALIPFVAALLLAFVAYLRWRLAPLRTK